ncbi:MAG: DUF58 domain-containing protein [Rubrivivax sp.]
MTRRPRVRLRLTASGAGLLGLALVLFLMAINEGNNLLYALAFLILALNAASALLGWWNLQGLRATVVAAPSAVAGDDGLVQVRVDPGGRGRHALQIGLLADGAGAAPAATAWHELPADAAAVLDVPWHAPRRGWQRARSLRLSSGYPLGLAVARLDLACALRRLAWPRPLAAAPAAAARAAGSRHEAAFSFTGLSAWRSGDSPRRLAWRALARGGPPQVKRFDGEAGRPALLLRWQDEAGDDEQRLRALARRLLDAHAAGRDWVLQLPGDAAPAPALQGPAALQAGMQRLALHGRADA